MQRLAVVLLASAACSASPAAPDAAGDAAPIVTDGSAALPAPIAAGDFPHALDKAFIRAPQTWLTDAAFDVKWADMLGSPISLLGGADSAYHADLATRATPLPGGEVICHGDAKLDNFGWLAAGGGTFSDIDFDDAGACPAAADILHFLVATDLALGDPQLVETALTAYIDSLAAGSAATAIDPATQPVWDDVRTKGLGKVTKKSKLVLGGEVQAATADEIAAVTALAAADSRFPTSVLDIARDVQATGGSGGLRRFWLLVEDAQHPRTVLELKELVTPGTELGPHSTTYDDATRFDTLKAFWWETPAPGDHFGVDLLGARFLARDRYGHQTPDPTKLSAAQVQNLLAAEASLLARRHAGAWTGVDPAALRAWLAASAATLTARWHATYTVAGGA